MSQETITTQEILRQSINRNRYFYGMLMTVRDFTMEQDHFTAKRLVSNRLLFGSGVICGLQVEKVGADPTTTIEIKPGVAIDPLGREVTVLDVPGGNKFDLSKIIVAPSLPAPPPFTGDKKGFICLSHRECPKDPVPSLKSSPCDEACEASRWNETFDITWDENTSAAPQPSLCEKWLNRTSVVGENSGFRIERTTPLWVRANEVFEVVVRVTAKQDAINVRITETRTAGSLIEPTPALAGTGQFPTTPVNLKAGEFLVYVYQVKSPAAAGTFQLALNKAGLPAPTSTIEVLTEADAKLRESELTVEVNSGEPLETCVRIAELTLHFTAGKPDGISDIRNLAAPRFRYSLERVTEILDCLRARLLAEAGSPRPGHAFVTFNDFEPTPPKPVGPTAAPGNAFAYAGREHVHALLRPANSGLEFVGAGNNELRINGEIGGEAIRFLTTVKGQKPIEAEDLVTKNYVDANVAGLDWQESVLDKDLTAPPANPKEGDRYLLFNEPTDTWKGEKNTKGKRNDIATFNGKTWDFTTPDEGTATFVEDENVAYMFVDGNWIPFLAAPTVAAGDGLVANGALLSVGRGKGIVVNADDVAIAYDANAPQPIGPVASAGSSDTAARGNHAHRLLIPKDGGLVFEEKGLRIDGPAAGANIDFLNPVAGQDPRASEHLATKKYVDEHAVAMEAGNGLVRKDNVVHVGQGAGIKVNADDVAVAFEAGLPQPIGPLASPGTPLTVSPGNHVHAIRLGEGSGLIFDDKGLRIDGSVSGRSISFLNPVAGADPQRDEHLTTRRYVDQKVAAARPINTPGATTGLVSFIPGNSSKRFTDSSGSINPGLGNGPISVQLAYVDPNSKGTYFCDATGMNGIFPILGVPNVLLVAKILLGTPTTFEVLVDMSPNTQPIPASFQVRWFAYWPGIEIPEVKVPIRAKPPSTDGPVSDKRPPVA
jgi:uncharacterized protein DUF2793